MDVGSVVVYVMMLPLILAVLYLLAWKEIDDGTGYGINRNVFWLLLVGGTIGLIGNIPVFYWGGSFMAINVGGALIPIAISIVLLVKYYRPAANRVLAIVFACWGSASVVSLVLSALNVSWVFVVATYLLATLPLLFFSSREGSPTGSVFAALPQYALLSIATVGTYLTTYVEINVGIVSVFPLYLLPPFAVAILAVIFRLTKGDSPGLAYAAMTLGAVVGADVLHQPPLYARGVTPFLGAIGGAGPLDLVFLSGLLSLSIALLLTLGLDRIRIGSRAKASSPPGPLSVAMSAFEETRYAEVADPVLAAVSAQINKTNRLLADEPHSHSQVYGSVVGGTAVNMPGPQQIPPGIDELPLHSMVKADYANLRAIAREKSPDRATAWKALCTGLFIMRALKEVCQRRLASSIDRTSAFLLDIAITMGPAAVVLWLLYLQYNNPGGTQAYLSISYQAAMYAAAAYPLVVLAFMEWFAGTTPGKWIVGIRVVSTDLRHPTILQVIGRNVTKLITTTPLAIAMGLAIAFGFEGGIGGLLLASVLAIGGVMSVFITGGMGVLVMMTNSDRKRVGDLMAGTQVLRVVRRKAPRLPSPSLPSPFGPA
jgi:uncharacterized RDD family membrane protein YckC/uncharacterized membrane protein